MAGDPTIRDNRSQAYETIGLDRRMREQMERYRSQGFDIDGFDFMPFEGGEVFHLDDQDPPNRYQAWMQKDDAGEWGVVFLDYESAQNVYAQQALPVLEAARQGEIVPETITTLAWVANRSALDDREPPEGITSFFMLEDRQGNVWGCNNEHMHLIGPDGEIIEPQDDMYPPGIFDLATGQLATGYTLQVNAENPPAGMPEGLTDENGIVDPMAARALIGFLQPDPENPDGRIRFNPAEESFIIAELEVDSPQTLTLEAARAIGAAASFVHDEMEFIQVPPQHLTTVEIRIETTLAEPAPEAAAPDAEVSPSEVGTPRDQFPRMDPRLSEPEEPPSEAPVEEPAAEVEEETLSPLEQARANANDRFYNSITERVKRGELGASPAEPDPVDAEAETRSLIAGTQLMAYIDILDIDNGDSYRSLLTGEFGEPSDMDKAFVAEKLYEHIIQNSSNEEFLTPDRLQVYQNLQEELPQLREAAGYSALAANTQAGSYIFFGEPSHMPDLGEGRLMENHGYGDIAVYEYDVPAGAPGTITADSLIGQTSFMNDPEFSAAFEAHRQAVEAMEVRGQEALARGETLELNEEDLEPLSRPMLPTELSADPNAPLDFSIQYQDSHPGMQILDLPHEHGKSHYFDYADMMVEGIVAQEGGREAIIADFLENNDPSVFPLRPVLNDDGNNIMTVQLQGQVMTFWENADGEEIGLSAEQLGSLLERAIDTQVGAEGLQAFLEEHPEMESALQFMAMSIDTIEEVEQGNLAPDIDYDAPDPSETISPREQHEINLRIQM